MTVGIILMALVTLAILAVPFLRQPRITDDGSAEQEERHRLFAQLADLEYDFYMDKISRRDYELVRRQLLEQLTSLLAEGKAMEEELRRNIRAEVAARLEKRMQHG